jgi:hypothetical protein
MSKRDWWDGSLPFLFGNRIDRRLILIGVASLSAFCITLSIVLYVLTRQTGPENATNFPETSDTPLTLKSASPTVATLERHLTATGLEGTESLIFEGTYLTRGVSFELLIFAKSPHYFRQRLRHHDLEIITAWNGELYVEHNPLSQLGDQAVIRQNLNRLMLILQSSLATIAWQYLNDGSDPFNWQEFTQIDGTKCAVLVNEELLEVPVQHYLDVKTGLELRRKVIFELAGEVASIRIDYDYDPSPNGGLHLPKRYTLYLNELTIAEAELAQVRPNVGMMPWMFESLEEPTQTGE